MEQQRKVLGIRDGGGEQLLIILDTARKTVPGTFCPGSKVATAFVPGLRPGCITITCPCQESKLENGFNRWQVVQTSLFCGTSVSTKRVLFAHQSPWDQAPAWQIQPRGGFVWYRMIQTCNSDRMVGTQIKCPGNSRVAITATDTVESE